MIKIEITIPLNYNNKEPIESYKRDKIKRELLREFKGLSISYFHKGYWIDNDKEYEDLNEIYTVITEKTIDSLSWIKNYKLWLMHSLEQKDIFIVISEVSLI